MAQIGNHFEVILEVKYAHDDNPDCCIGTGQSLIHGVIFHSCDHWIILKNKASIILRMDLSFHACCNTLPESNLHLFCIVSVQSLMIPLKIMLPKSTT